MLLQVTNWPLLFQLIFVIPPDLCYSNWFLLFQLIFVIPTDLCYSNWSFLFKLIFFILIDLCYSNWSFLFQLIFVISIDLCYSNWSSSIYSCTWSNQHHFTNNKKNFMLVVSSSTLVKWEWHRSYLQDIKWICRRRLLKTDNAKWDFTTCMVTDLIISDLV